MDEKIKDLALEITNDCQSSCGMCLHRLSSRTISYMPLKLIRKIIREAEALKIGTSESPVLICGVGEPTLHPAFEEVIDIVSILPFNFATNCQNLRQNYIVKLLDAKCSNIILSIDAVTPNTYSLMRPGLKFDVVIESVKILLLELYGRSQQPKVDIQMVLTKYNAQEVIPFIEYWLPLIEELSSVSIFIKQVYAWPGIAEAERYWPSPIPLIPELLKHPQLKIGTFDKPAAFRNDCKLMWMFAQIHSDGAYSPCCMNADDIFEVGNLETMSLMECYNSEKMRQYRKWFEDGEFFRIPFCKDCR